MRERLPPIPFDEIARAAAVMAPAIAQRWLPEGRLDRNDWVAKNPTRADTRLGSFKVCVRGSKAGVWRDFATGEGGRSLIALRQYLTGDDAATCARFVAKLVGHPFGETRPPEKRTRTNDRAADHRG